jgi:gamma-glutamyltranspeptidase/glutathione hydrolase
MVTAPHHLAAHAGLDILKDGGNAIEAAVAVAACLAVVYPHMTGIGGDGFWLVHEPDGRVWSIDACGRSAQAADRSLYEGLDTIPWRGPLAANTVASTVSGWQAALDASGGTLPLARLLRDAIHHADAGVVVTRGGAAIADGKGPELRIQPGAYAAIFEPTGRPLREGEVLKQPRLARTLAALADRGLQDFYTGEVSRRIAADLAALGSPLTAADLAAHRAERPDPLSISIRGAKLYNQAPPTQGVAALLILALFDRLEAHDAESFAHVHGLVEATKQAFRFRDAHVGDPAWMAVDPQELLNDTIALDAMAAAIDPARAAPWPHPPALGDTTWFAAADGEGRVVSCIQSTYFEFGSGIVLPETGIVWQNRGSSFRLAPDGWNALAPGRKPFHTLNPALAKFDDGRVMAYGTMGGEGQPQTQAAIFSRYARFGVPLQEAVTRPRWLLGRTWGETSTSLKIEDRFDPSVIDALRSAGHDVELVAPFTATMGHAGAIVRHADGVLEGATDPRSDGMVAAW